MSVRVSVCGTSQHSVEPPIIPLKYPVTKGLLQLQLCITSISLGLYGLATHRRKARCYLAFCFVRVQLFNCLDLWLHLRVDRTKMILGLSLNGASRVKEIILFILIALFSSSLALIWDRFAPPKSVLMMCGLIPCVGWFICIPQRCMF